MTTLLRTALALICTSPSLAADLFVDQSLASGANDGSSWSDAFQGTDGLQAALAAASAGDRIFVAIGQYRTSSTGQRSASFVLRNDVELYGGFLGGETSPDERPQYGPGQTFLTGDLMGDDPAIADNAYHVVRSVGNQPSAVLDGFAVVGGNADGPSGSDDRGGGILCISNSRPTIRNCSFSSNRCTFGGGAGYVNGAPTFVNCSFVGNFGGAFGGAFDIAVSGAIRFDRCWFENNRAQRAGALEIFSTSGATITNSVFLRNVATGSSGGGAFWIGSGGSTSIRNCTVVENRASAHPGGGVALSGSGVSIANSIFWNNEGQGGAQGLANQLSGVATQSVTYSIVEGIGGGTGNLGADPRFIDQAMGDLSLFIASPAIDAGDNGAIIAAPTGPDIDFAGKRRRHDQPGVANTGAGVAPIVDIGAFEFGFNFGTPFCTATSNSTGRPAQLDALGTPVASANSTTLVATGLPQNSNAFFLTSRIGDFVPNPGGSSGNLCLGGAIGRYVGPGQVQNSGATGEVSLNLDLTQHPTPTGLVLAQAGETWRFQAWYRDSVLGFPTSNFSDGLAVTFE